MSDLQCPARILIVRHGEATYERPNILTDAGGVLTETGRRQAQDVADRVAGDRVAAVYTSRLGRAQETAGIVGERLGLPVTVVDGVEEFHVGSLEGKSWSAPEAGATVLAWAGGDLARRWPGAESGDEVVVRFVAALEGLADRHRGETVVVVSHGGVMTLASRIPLSTPPPRLAGSWTFPTERSPPSRSMRTAGGWLNRGRDGRGRHRKAGQNSRAPTSSMPRSAS